MNHRRHIVLIARNRGSNFFFLCVCVSSMKGGFSPLPFTSGQAVSLSLSIYFCSAFDADARFSPLKKKTEKSTMKEKGKDSSFDSCHLRFFFFLLFMSLPCRFRTTNYDTRENYDYGEPDFRKKKGQLLSRIKAESN